MTADNDDLLDQVFSMVSLPPVQLREDVKVKSVAVHEEYQSTESRVVEQFVHTEKVETTGFHHEVYHQEIGDGDHTMVFHEETHGTIGGNDRRESTDSRISSLMASSEASSVSSDETLTKIEQHERHHDELNENEVHYDVVYETADGDHDEENHFEYHGDFQQAPVIPAPRTHTGSVVSQHSIAESAAKSLASSHATGVSKIASHAGSHVQENQFETESERSVTPKAEEFHVEHITEISEEVLHEDDTGAVYRRESLPAQQEVTGVAVIKSPIHDDLIEEYKSHPLFKQHQNDDGNSTISRASLHRGLDNVYEINDVADEEDDSEDESGVVFLTSMVKRNFDSDTIIEVHNPNIKKRESNKLTLYVDNNFKSELHEKIEQRNAEVDNLQEVHSTQDDEHSVHSVQAHDEPEHQYDNDADDESLVTSSTRDEELHQTVIHHDSEPEWEPRRNFEHEALNFEQAEYVSEHEYDAPHEKVESVERHSSGYRAPESVTESHDSHDEEDTLKGTDEELSVDGYIEQHDGDGHHSEHSSPVGDAVPDMQVFASYNAFGRQRKPTDTMSSASTIALVAHTGGPNIRDELRPVSRDFILQQIQQQEHHTPAPQHQVYHSAPAPQPQVYHIAPAPQAQAYHSARTPQPQVYHSAPAPQPQIFHSEEQQAELEETPVYAASEVSEGFVKVTVEKRLDARVAKHLPPDDRFTLKENVVALKNRFEQQNFRRYDTEEDIQQALRHMDAALPPSKTVSEAPKSRASSVATSVATTKTNGSSVAVPTGPPRLSHREHYYTSGTHISVASSVVSEASTVKSNGSKVSSKAPSHVSKVSSRAPSHVSSVSRASKASSKVSKASSKAPSHVSESSTLTQASNANRASKAYGAASQDVAPVHVDLTAVVPRSRTSTTTSAKSSSTVKTSNTNKSNASKTSHVSRHSEVPKSRSSTLKNIDENAELHSYAQSQPTRVVLHENNSYSSPNPNDKFQSVRVVKNVRRFVQEWGSKDFCPPQHPVVFAPRSPIAKLDAQPFVTEEPIAYPEPAARHIGAARRDSVQSGVSDATSVSVHSSISQRSARTGRSQSIHSNHTQHTERSHQTGKSAHSQHDQQSLHSAATGTTKSSKHLVDAEINHSQQSSRRTSVSSTATLTEENHLADLKSPAFEEHQATEMKVRAETILLTHLVPVKERRTFFEAEESYNPVKRNFSINRRNINTDHLPPMVSLVE